MLTLAYCVLVVLLAVGSCTPPLHPLPAAARVPHPLFATPLPPALRTVPPPLLVLPPARPLARPAPCGPRTFPKRPCRLHRA